MDYRAESSLGEDMVIVCGIIVIAALVITGICYAVSGKRHICLCWLSVSVSLYNLGFFLISMAKTMDFSLNSNRLACFGQICLPILLLFMLLREYGLSKKDDAAPVEAAPGTRENGLSDIGMVVSFTSENIERICESYEAASTLTDREKEVFRCILEDMRRKDIADKLCLSESTIKKYTSSIFRKLSVENRKELFSNLARYMTEEAPVYKNM